jgi:predicted MFS family arabinose efflux permease
LVQLTLIDRSPLRLSDRASLGAAMVVPAVLGGGVPALGNLFVLSLMAEYKASRGTIIFLVEAGMVTSLLAGPLIGRLLLRIAPWIMMLIGAFGGAFALMAASSLHNLAGTMASYGLAHMFGAAFCGTVAAQTYVVRRNPDRLGIISGGQVVMSAVFGAILSLSIPKILVTQGWRTAGMVYAAAALVILLPLIMGLLRDRATAPGSHPETKDEPVNAPVSHPVPSTLEILRMGPFWLLMLAIVPLSVTGLAISINVLPFYAERGIGTQQASLVLAGIGVAAAIGALSVGAIVDRFHPALAMAGIAALSAIGLGAIAAGIGNPAYLFVAIYLGVAGVAPTLAVGVERLFGAAAYPPIMGLVGPFLLLSAFSGAATGWLRDHMGSYLPVFGIIAAMCAVSLAASLFLLRHPLSED